MEKQKTQPVYFFGHGSPMNIIEENGFTKALINEASQFPQEMKAIVVISAHWLTKGTLITSNSPDQKLIYDFGGFPKELYSAQYPAKGSLEIAEKISSVIKEVNMTNTWGLDHGSWTVLKYAYPKANVPVLQLSIDINLSLHEHLKLAEKLQPLRDQGILFISSGNIVHNIPLYMREHAYTYEWAEEFDKRITKAILNHDSEYLATIDFKDPVVRQSVPTLDHYIPLLYTMGLSSSNEEKKWIYEGFQNASMSMRSFKVGS